MGLVVVVLVAAVGIGLLAGGRLAHLGLLRLRLRSLVLAALLAQLGGALLGSPAYVLGLALSALLTLLFLAVNRGTAGIGSVAAGLLLNAVVVAANGAMPVSEAAVRRAGLSSAELRLETDPRHEPSTPDTRLPLLGDVVPVPLPLRPEVVSPGDVLVAAGLGQVVALGVRGAPARRVRKRRRH